MYVSLPFSTSSVRTNDNAILPPRDLLLDVSDHKGLGKKIVHGDIKKSLDLARMEVHRDDMVAARRNNHIRDELRGNGGATLVLLVHARVREARDDGRDAARRRSLACRDEDEELHEVVIDVAAAALEDEDVFFAHGLGDLDARLTVGELAHLTLSKRDVQPGIAQRYGLKCTCGRPRGRSSPLGHGLGELWMGVPCAYIDVEQTNVLLD